MHDHVRMGRPGDVFQCGGQVASTLGREHMRAK